MEKKHNLSRLFTQVKNYEAEYYNQSLINKFIAHL